MSYEGLRTRVTAFDDLAASASNAVQLTGGGEPLLVAAVEVSPNARRTTRIDPCAARRAE